LTPTRTKALILGIGNTIRGDDGIGIYIARSIKKELISADIDVLETHEAGINLLELIAGYQKIVIIDSIKSYNGKPGSVYRFGRDDFRKKQPFFSSHQIGLSALFDFAERTNPEILKDITIYGVEVEKNDVFSEEITDKVKKSIPKVVKQVKTEIKKWQCKQ
jgi:hydrogenase maturation protease